MFNIMFTMIKNMTMMMMMVVLRTMM